jgi:hypothetical protein
VANIGIGPVAFLTVVEEIQGSNKEPQMVTTYIKIITKFEKEGKRIKIVEKKVPA